MKYLPKISQLLALKQVVHSGSIRSAAREFGQSQPAMSRRLSELEHVLGSQLLLRTKEGIILTEAGVAFSQRVEWILRELQRATEEVQQINSSKNGYLTIGLSSLISLTVLPMITDKLKQVGLTLREGQLPTLLPGVRSGEIDIAIATIDPMNPPEDVIIEPLFTAPFCVIARKGHPLENEENLIALLKAKWIIPNAQAGYYQQLQNELTHFYRELETSPIDTDSMINGLNMVLTSDYLAIGARALINGLNMQNKLVTLPIHNLPSAQYCAIWSQKSALTRDSQQFLKLLRHACQDYHW